MARARVGPRQRLGAIVAALALGSIMLVATPAASQTGPTVSCTDTLLSLQAGFGDRGQTLYSDPALGPQERLRVLDQPLPAGSYAFNAVSYDGYLERDTTAPQPDERWMVRFLDADGNVLATTDATEDLADLVLEDTWVGSIGTVTWEGPDAVAAVVVHAAAPDTTSPNSVEPVCVGGSAVNDAPPTTTAEPSIPTTDGPEVLPQVTTRPAEPVVVEPAFTG